VHKYAAQVEPRRKQRQEKACAALPHPQGVQEVLLFLAQRPPPLWPLPLHAPGPRSDRVREPAQSRTALRTALPQQTPRKARPARLWVTVSPCPPARPIAHSAQHRRSRRLRKARPAHPLVQRAVVQDVLVHGLEQLRRLLAHLVGRLAHGAAHLLRGAADLLRHGLDACPAWTRKSATRRARGALATAAKRPRARACFFRASPDDAAAGLPPRQQAAAERACRRRALLRRGPTSQSARGGPGEHFSCHHVDACHQL